MSAVKYFNGTVNAQINIQELRRVFVHVGADVETADKMTTYSKTAEVIVLNSSGKDLINTSIGDLPWM